MELFFPRYLLAELNTHRMIAKSAASSRAIPVKKRIAMVRDDPYVPSIFGENKPGMQADQSLEQGKNEAARDVWLASAYRAAGAAEDLWNLGVHKQQANRLLEPYVFVVAVVTFTESSNFFNLRCHPDADPEFQTLAWAIRDAYEKSTPDLLDHSHWHAPYLTDADEGLDPLSQLKVSAARCARVSYKTHDGRTPDLNSDLDLAETLLAHRHMSPFDHQAVPVDERAFTQLAIERCQRQFVGWIPYRVFVEDNAGMDTRRFYNYEEVRNVRDDAIPAGDS